MCVSVCSRTLWIGHISKQTTEDELQQELNKHGEATVQVSMQDAVFWRLINGTLRPVQTVRRAEQFRAVLRGTALTMRIQTIQTHVFA